jgi:hypothetical protein
MNRSILIALAWLFMTLAAQAQAEWQFALDVPGTQTFQQTIHAAMWIPPACKRVRGILLAPQQVILEDKVLQDPAMRAMAAKEDLAFVLLSRGALGDFDYKVKRDDLRLQAVLDALAVQSGYDEIATAPLIALGHSGGAITAWDVAYWKPSRMIAVVSLHAAAIPPPAWDPKANVNGVPILGISGEYESWGDPNVPLDMHWRWLRGRLLEYRASQQEALMSILVDPGGSHFSFNPPMAQYVAMFVAKAVEARAPVVPGVTYGPSPLRHIPIESGWLTDETPLRAGPNEHPAAPYEQYTGDPSLAFWHIDGELAHANKDYRRSDRGKLDQRVTCGVGGKMAKATWLEDLPFAPQFEADGSVTVKVEGGFLTETPSGVAGSGRPLGHAGGPVQFSLIGGWNGGGKQDGPDSFVVQPGHLGPSDNLMMLAYHPGDERYAYAEQPCEVKWPKVNQAGKPQTIDFAPLADRDRSVKEIQLHAASSSGRGVHFYIAQGPAEIDGNRLVFTPIPPRTKMPVKVTVVAYQWGTTQDPAVQSAKPVERSFFLTAEHLDR